MLLLALIGCLGQAALVLPPADTATTDTGAPPTGFTDGPIEQPPDTGSATAPIDLYASATLAIDAPAAGSVWPIPATVPLRARLVGADGATLPALPIVWTSHLDPALALEGDDLDVALPIGAHRLTARAILPDGTGLAHSVGEVRVQSDFTGTYAGLFQVDLDTLGVVFSCTGASTVVVGPYGREGVGDGSCLLAVPLIGLDLPLDYVFDLDLAEDGTVSGDAGVDILLITYNFPAAGTLDPNGAGFDVTFAGEVPLLGPIDAFVSAPRVGLGF